MSIFDLFRPSVGSSKHATVTVLLGGFVLIGFGLIGWFGIGVVGMIVIAIAGRLFAVANVKTNTDRSDPGDRRE